MRRTPEIQRFLDGLARNVGISPEEQAALDEASDHPGDCHCEVCKQWWQDMGPDPDIGRYGPFTKEEIMEEPREGVIDRNTCYLCGAGCEDEEMMLFNTVFDLGEESGKVAIIRDMPLCLACWGKHPDDTAVVYSILQKMKEEQNGS